MQKYINQQLFTVINAFLLLFIFIAGGLNKIANFKDTASHLETKINEIQLNPIFITSILVTIFYFYLNMLKANRLLWLLKAKRKMTRILFSCQILLF